MTLRQYLILMTVGTFICWIAWFFVIWSTDPYHAGFAGFLFFYVSLFIALLGTFSVVGFWIKRRLFRADEVVFRHVKRTFRQGMFASILIIAALLLLQHGLLTWWNGALLIFLFFILEGIIFTNRRYSNRDYV